MPYAVLGDPSLWNIHSLDKVQIYYITGDNAGSGTISSFVIKDDSSFSITPIEASSKSSIGMPRTVGYKIEADLRLIVTNWLGLTDNLDNYSLEYTNDFDFDFKSPDGDWFRVSLDSLTSGKVFGSSLEFKTTSEGIPEMTLKLKAMVKKTSFSNIFRSP